MIKKFMYGFLIISALSLTACDNKEKPTEAKPTTQADDETATLFSFGGVAKKLGALTAKSDLGYNIVRKVTPKKYENQLIYGHVEQQAENALESGLGKAKKIGGKITSAGNAMARKFDKMGMAAEQKLKSMTRNTAVGAAYDEAKSMAKSAEAKYNKSIAPRLEMGASEIATEIGARTAGSPTASNIAKKLTPRKYEGDFAAGQRAGR